MKPVISVSITQDLERKCWAYAVSIADAVHKIGYGEEYDDAARMAKKGVKSALKCLTKNPHFILHDLRPTEPEQIKEQDG